MEAEKFIERFQNPQTKQELLNKVAKEFQEKK
jgi:hypothetical protein